jgi:hypothetical protein
MIPGDCVLTSPIAVVFGIGLDNLLKCNDSRPA